MYLFSDNDDFIDAEFSFSVTNGNFSIIVESSGGGTESIKRRNPEYNKLVSIILRRLKKLKIDIEGIFLESKKYSHLPESNRKIILKYTYPINLNSIDLEVLRKQIGSNLAKTLQKDGVTTSGMTQKRFRLDLSKVISENDMLYSTGVSSSNIDTEMVKQLSKLTEGISVIMARKGQGEFRENVLKKKKFACELTGIKQKDFLIASHIKPWSVSTNEERLDPNNGLLLFCSHDNAFDSGYISFDFLGRILISSKLDQSVISELKITKTMQILVTEKNSDYLSYHRSFIFQA